MLPWLIACVAGAAAAVWLYGRRVPHDAYHRALLALRAVAIVLIVALVLDAPLGARAAPRPLVALDVSASWGQGGGARFAEAAARARGTQGDLILFGDSLRAGATPQAAGDGASRVGPAVDRAAALGRPLDVITDGQLDDAETLDALPAGSRVEVIPAIAGVDAAVRSIELPATAAPGDSVELRALIVSAGALVPAAKAQVRLSDGSTL